MKIIEKNLDSLKVVNDVYENYYRNWFISLIITSVSMVIFSYSSWQWLSGLSFVMFFVSIWMLLHRQVIWEFSNKFTITKKWIIGGAGKKQYSLDNIKFVGCTTEWTGGADAYEVNYAFIVLSNGRKIKMGSNEKMSEITQVVQEIHNNLTRQGIPCYLNNNP